MRTFSSVPHRHIIDLECPARMTTSAAVPRTDARSGDADLARSKGSCRSARVEAALSGCGQFDPSVGRDLRVDVHQVHHRPGAGVSVGYRVQFTTPRGPVRDYVVASTAPQAGDGDGVAVLNDGVRTVRMWRRPFDPAIPGLRAASDPAVVAAWLREAGYAVEEPVQVRSVSYRPTRRAVLRADAGELRVFTKVIPERKAEV